MSLYTPGEPLVTLVTLGAVDRLGNAGGVAAGAHITYLRQVIERGADTWHVGELVTDGQQLVVTFQPHQVTRPTQGPQAA